jgi:hypothetical protein
VGRKRSALYSKLCSYRFFYWDTVETNSGAVEYRLDLRTMIHILVALLANSIAGLYFGTLFWS